MLPRTGDVLHVTRAASVQFLRPIKFRVIRVLDWPTYDGWLWLDGDQLTMLRATRSPDGRSSSSGKGCSNCRPPPNPARTRCGPAVRSRVPRPGGLTDPEPPPVGVPSP